MSAKKTVIEFFTNNSEGLLSLDDEEKLLNCNYLDEGVIDSFGIVVMITELEEKLNVKFTAKDMQSYEFQSIGGLISLLEEKIGNDL